MNALITAPNEEYLELNFVKETATGRGLNEKFVMENLHNGRFRVTDGRVGITIGRYKPKVYELSMDKWLEIFQGKIRRGFIVTKTKKMDQKEISKDVLSVNGQNYKPIADESVKIIVERLLNFTSKCIENNYSCKVDDVSPEMIQLGNELISRLSDGIENFSIAEFNNLLKRFYQVIPRRIDKLSNNLAKSKSDFRDIVANEQDLYEIIKTGVRDFNNSDGKTILEANSLKIRTVTDNERDYIIKKLGSDGSRYVNAWKVINEKTEKAFGKYCETENLTDENRGISHLFHGSRNENFWSIISTGLNINPKGVVITGKAYGNGTYFAPSARKSLGYTSRAGSKWASGSEATGFLGIYKVATGKRYDGSHGCDHGLDYNKLQQICPGAHCTWAEARYSGFMMDEVIVYKNEQSTVEYLVEVGL